MNISRRVLIIVGVSFVILIGIVASLSAYILSQSNVSSANVITPTPTITATPKPGVRACALGVITSIQSIGTQSFVVSESRGKQMVTVTVNAQTTIHKRGVTTSLSFTDLMVGQQVRVTAQDACNKQASTFVAKNILIIAVTGSPTPIASPTPTA
jgi:hypothetical protein